jgi:hypothetical protein
MGLLAHVARTLSLLRRDSSRRRAETSPRGVFNGFGAFP